MFFYKFVLVLLQGSTMLKLKVYTSSRTLDESNIQLFVHEPLVRVVRAQTRVRQVPVAHVR